MTAVAVCSVALCVWTLTPRSRGRDRLRGLGPARPGAPRQPRRRLVQAPVPRAGLCAGALAMVGWVLAGPVAALAGLPAGVLLSVWIGRLEPPSAARAREEVNRDLPLAVDLLAACVFVGLPPQESLSVVSRAVGGVLGARFDEITARLSLGADPAAEWARCSQDPLLAHLGRTMQRSAESGAPLAEGLARLAEDCRRERRTQVQLRARNVGVKAAGPLAACFLPAFMLVGVVPTVAGSFQHLFA